MTQDGLNALELQRMMKPFVAMVIREAIPKKDEISTNQAYRDYGRRWIDSKTLSGDLTPAARGGKTIYSRAQIEALRAVETVQPALSQPRKRGRRRKSLAVVIPDFKETKLPKDTSDLIHL